jgi:hypothetical protein
MVAQGNGEFCPSSFVNNYHSLHYEFIVIFELESVVSLIGRRGMADCKAESDPTYHSHLEDDTKSC